MKNREQAFRSGAQFILADYAQPDRRFSDYRVPFPGDAYVPAKIPQRDPQFHPRFDGLRWLEILAETTGNRSRLPTA